jgi:hypothetical protein
VFGIPVVEVERRAMALAGTWLKRPASHRKIRIEFTSPEGSELDIVAKGSNSFISKIFLSEEVSDTFFLIYLFACLFCDELFLPFSTIFSCILVSSIKLLYTHMLSIFTGLSCSVTISQQPLSLTCVHTVTFSAEEFMTNHWPGIETQIREQLQKNFPSQIQKPPREPRNNIS